MNNVHYVGLEGIQAAPIVANLVRKGQKAVVVTATQGIAASFSKNLTFFLGGFADVFALSDDDPPFLRTEAKSHETEVGRLLAMEAMDSDLASVTVCPVSMLIREICSPESYNRAVTLIKIGSKVLRDDLIRRLAESGYRRVPYTESPGSFSARGDIVDVFPLNESEPQRISFFDTEIETIRTFDPLTQKTYKSSKDIEMLSIAPAVEPVPEGLTFADWCDLLIVIDPDRILRALKLREEEAMQDFEVLAEEGEASGEDWDAYRGELFWEQVLEQKQPVLFTPYGEAVNTAAPPREDPSAVAPASEAVYTDALPMSSSRRVSATTLANFGSKIDFARKGRASNAILGPSKVHARFARNSLALFRKYRLRSASAASQDGAVVPTALLQHETIVYEAKYTAAFYGQLDLLAAELKKYLRNKFTVTMVASTKSRLDSLREFAEQEGISEKIHFSEGELSAGFELTSESLVWLWDGDIFKTGKKRRSSKIKGHEKISAFTDIEKGDYIVHEKHGIGIYKGIKTIETYGVKRDYLTISYYGKDVLYLPAEQMDRVQKYVGGGEKRPRINKLGTEDWSKTKSKVRAEIETYAAELLLLAAQRKLSPGFAFSKDNVWLKDFEDRFPYEPTPDQIRCFESVRSDMENPWPMDRLICGDVGYGKTEVALRAVFKCVQDGKQTAMLVPTTILASQHFRTFSERFSDFPVRVEVLSRFNSTVAQNEILKSLSDGSVDIVIGTHALLSSKVKFKDLGLLIIDEEQRFGVKHKEKIRALKSGVDVLTLTATPIPRTLNMSLLGIKDMELIEDPPEDRYPVRTFVSEERPDVISEGIRRELDRGGQVYVVFNRVGGIEQVAEQLRLLVPQARIAVCHAKMNKSAIENVMQDFYENDYDVLLSTTIIESGLDIPNVNTIVILDADRLGLTQLYQLRGRVGRSNRIAFAYLMYRRDKILTETAEKRLRTIREFTQFGSGFKIAMKDLEIRGAGALLGLSQHGHMVSVGYEMYCKLMDEAVARLSGDAPLGPETESECRVELPSSAVIPQGYIEDEIVKLQVYKRIASVNDEASRTAVIDEMSDRFGPVPSTVASLIYAAWLRHLGDAIGLTEIKLKTRKAYFTYGKESNAGIEQVFKASERAHQLGGVLEADMKAVPKLKLSMSHGTSEANLIEVAVSVLSVLVSK